MPVYPGAPPVPAATLPTFHAPYAGRFLGAALQALHPNFHGLGSSSSTRRRALTTRQASHHAADRSVAPPTGVSTLGLDPAPLQTEPPARYRASWQPPGQDSHPLATTSLRWTRSPHSTTSNSGRTKNKT